jgi:hypothetical protein
MADKITTSHQHVYQNIKLDIDTLIGVTVLHFFQCLHYCAFTSFQYMYFTFCLNQEKCGQKHRLLKSRVMQYPIEKYLMLNSI